MTRYPIEIRAMTLVYLRESNLRKNERGITISLRSVSARRSYTGDGGASHERCHPEMSVDEELRLGIRIEPAHDTRHEVANNDEIADANTKALYRDRRVENDSSIRVGDLTERKETGRSSVQIACASSLKVKTESCSQA